MSDQFSQLSNEALRSIVETGNMPEKAAPAEGAIDPTAASAPEKREGADLLSTAGVAAGAGAAAAAVPYIGKVAATAASRTREATFPGDVDETALRRIHRALKRDQYDLTKASEAKRLRDGVMTAIPKPFTLGDAGKVGVQRLLENAYLNPGEASFYVGNILDERKTGRAARMADDVRSLISKRTDYHDTLASLIENRREQAGKLYDDAYAKGFLPAPEVMNYIERAEEYRPGIIERAIRKAKLKWPDLDIEKTVLGEGYRQRKQFTASEENMKALDMVKRSIDDEILANKVKDPGVANDLRENVLRPFRTILKDTNPEYAKALGYYSSAMETEEALEAGRAFLRKDPSEMAAYVKKLSSGDQELFRIGAAHELMDQLGRAADRNASPIRQIVGNPKADPNISRKQQQLKIIFEDPKLFDEFMKRAKEEAQMEARERAVFGNSKTAERLLTAADEEAGIARGTSLKGRAINFLVDHVTSLGEGKREAVRKRIAERMLDPTEFSRTVDDLRAHALKAAQRAAMPQGTGIAGGILGGLGAGAAYWLGQQPEKPPQGPLTAIERTPEPPPLPGPLPVLPGAR